MNSFRPRLDERYLEDPVFRSLVDMMYATMEQHKITASELRDAAFVAAMKYESLHIRELFIISPKDWEKFRTR